MAATTTAGTDELTEPAGGDVPAQVHLEEPVLSLHVPLRPEQVGGRARVDLGHALVVPQNRDLGVQAGQGVRAVPAREGPAHHGRRPDRHDEDHDDDERQQGQDRKGGTHNSSRVRACKG